MAGLLSPHFFSFSDEQFPFCHHIWLFYKAAGFFETHNSSHWELCSMHNTPSPIRYLFGVLFCFIILVTVVSGTTDITIAYEGSPTQNYLNTAIEETGFYEKAGLTVTPEFYDTPKEAAMSVINGQSDFAIVTSYAIAEVVSEGYQPVILTSVFRLDAVNYIIVDQNAGISNPEDLNGKRIGYDPNGFWGYYLDQFLTLNSIDPSSLTLVPIPSKEIVPELRAGTIDAGVIIYQSADELRKDDPSRYEVWPVNNNENLYLVLICNPEMKKNPEVIRKLIGSLMEFGDYINGNFDQMKQLIGSKSGVDSDTAQDLISGVSTEISLTYSLLSVLESQSRYIIGLGNASITQTPDYLQIIDFSYLDEMNPQGVTIIHE